MSDINGPRDADIEKANSQLLAGLKSCRSVVENYRAMLSIEPDEPDHQGYVIRSGTKWAFSYAIGEEDDEDLFHLEGHPLRQGEYLTLTEPDGERLPFRVMRISSVDGAGRAFIPGPPPGD